MNSKGFRDEDGNFITIPGKSVKYNQVTEGHLAKFGEDGFIEDGGETSQFADAAHKHHKLESVVNEGESPAGAGVEVYDDADMGVIDLMVKDVDETAKHAEINTGNIGHINRILKGYLPSAIAQIHIQTGQSTVVANLNGVLDALWNSHASDSNELFPVLLGIKPDGVSEKKYFGMFECYSVDTTAYIKVYVGTHEIVLSATKADVQGQSAATWAATFTDNSSYLTVSAE